MCILRTSWLRMPVSQVSCSWHDWLINTEGMLRLMQLSPYSLKVTKFGVVLSRFKVVLSSHIVLSEIILQDASRKCLSNLLGESRSCQGDTEDWLSHCGTNCHKLMA